MEARENEHLKAVVGNDIEAKVVIEDLVQLLHKKRDPQRAPLRLPRITYIYFTNPSEIPSLLSPQFARTHSELRAEAQAFIPQNVPQIKKIEDEEKEKARLEMPDVEVVDEVHEEPEPQEAGPATDEPVLIDGHEPTEQQISAVKKIQAAYRRYRRNCEISAARKIQAAYRRYRRRCEALTRAFGRGLKAQKYAVFAQCLKNVYASNWQKTPYRTLYLWAIPQLVICLDRVAAIAHKFKDKTKRQLSKENHERLEELGRQMNNIK